MIQWERQTVRQTAEHLTGVLKAAVARVRTLGVEPVAIVTDNAASMLASARDVDGVLHVGCRAHLGELLVKDVWQLWPEATGRAEQVCRPVWLTPVHFVGHFYCLFRTTDTLALQQKTSSTTINTPESSTCWPWQPWQVPRW